MNKIKKLIGATLLISNACLFAGTMGEDPIMYTNSVVPFVSLEGGYTWNQLKGFNYSTFGASINSTTKDDGWSGRFAAGLMIPYCETVAFSSELGYGYYGQTKYPLTLNGIFNGFTVDPASFDLRSSIHGLDILAGAYYRPGGYELFIKGGGLVENTQSKTRADYSTLTFGQFGGDSAINRTHTEVLPVVKLGGAFSFGTSMSVFAAWTHAFGSSPSVLANFGTAGSRAVEYNANYNGPTLDMLTLGFQYNFA